MPRAKCPSCEEEVFIKAGFALGDVVECDDCESKLEVVGMDPLEIDPFHEADEDNYDDGFNIFEND